MPPTAAGSQPWHLLQLSDVLDREFATALAESVPVNAWWPRRTFFPQRGVTVVDASNLPQMLGRTGPVIRPFPLLRGYARFPSIARIGPAIVAQLKAVTPDSRQSPLICTVPFFAAVAELWDGPVIYWLTDLIAEYGGSKGLDIPALDRRMCRRATLVCPNSERLRAYLIHEADCHPAKIQVVPNATRAANLLPSPPFAPAELPLPIRHIPRPIAGVIGNLAGNMDWLMIEQVIAETPGIHWVFVGPTTMAIPDRRHRRARQSVMRHPRAFYTGSQPYGDLAAYARAFDVALLPYLRCEPTYSGSSTRFYEHLAACRPMVATRGLEELSRKVPLVRLVDSSEEAVEVLHELQAAGFEDGYSQARWVASQDATWQVRAQTVQTALRERLAAAPPGNPSAFPNRLSA